MSLKTLFVSVIIGLALAAAMFTTPRASLAHIHTVDFGHQLGDGAYNYQDLYKDGLVDEKSVEYQGKYYLYKILEVSDVSKTAETLVLEYIKQKELLSTEQKLSWHDALTVDENGQGLCIRHHEGNQGCIVLVAKGSKLAEEIQREFLSSRHKMINE